MFEKKNKKVISSQAFMQRMLMSGLLTLLLLGGSLLLGVIGYRYLENMAWIDALLNASMILGGMGPVDVLHSNEGKIFASFYALYSGIFLIVCGGVLMAPIFHRILHRFHADSN